MSSLVDYTGNCGICLYPLVNGQKIAFHEKYTNKSGQTCDGSLHPLHLNCAIEAINANAMCHLCKIPINLKSLDLFSSKIIGCGKFVGTLIGLGSGIAVADLLNPWAMGNHLVVACQYAIIWGSIKAGQRGVIKILTTLNQSKYLEQLGTIISGNPGAKMITVDTRQKLYQGLLERTQFKDHAEKISSFL